MTSQNVQVEQHAAGELFHLLFSAPGCRQDHRLVAQDTQDLVSRSPDPNVHRNYYILFN